MLSSTDMSQKVPTIDRVDKASATKTIDLGSIRGRIKPKTKKNSYLQLSCLTFNTKRDSVKPPKYGGQVAA